MTFTKLEIETLLLRFIEEDSDPSVHPCDSAQKKIIRVDWRKVRTPGFVDGTKSLLVYQRIGRNAGEELLRVEMKQQKGSRFQA